MATKFTFATHKPPKRASWPKAGAPPAGRAPGAAAPAAPAARPDSRPAPRPAHAAPPAGQILDESDWDDGWAAHASELAREPMDPSEAWLPAAAAPPTALRPPRAAVPAPVMPVSRPTRVLPTATAPPAASRPVDPYAGVDPLVPPGSHYDAWVWSALDRPGHVTVELYVDAAATLPAQGQPARHGTRQLPRYTPPECDLRRHCLISVPSESHRAPWGDAPRVLLVPMTRRSQPDASGFHDPYPQGARAWLRGAPDVGVLLGHCLVAHPADPAGEREDLRAYWLILPQHWAQNADTAGALRARSLGAWHGGSAIDVVRAAINSQGPVMPADWPAEDVDQVRRLHPGFEGDDQDDAPQAGRARPRG